MTANRAETMNADSQRLAEYYQGSVIAADGTETPITDAMIQDACRKLEHSCLHSQFRTSRINTKGTQGFRRARA